jgi:hypothetical protein
MKKFLFHLAQINKQREYKYMKKGIRAQGGFFKKISYETEKGHAMA